MTTVETTPFEINDLHAKALLKLLHCHHSGIKLDYAQLSDGMYCSGCHHAFLIICA
jgi:hypothetical protein